MKDYRIEVKVKNNLLWQAMQSKGINNGAELARETGINQKLVSRYLNLQENVYDRYGNYKKSFQKICNYFNMMPVELYPEERMKDPLLKNKGVIEVSGAELKQLSGVETNPMALIHQQQVQESVRRLIDLISPREAKVINMKNGINDREYTFAEIAEEIGVSEGHVRTIHAKAIRKMRYEPRLDVAGIDRNFIGLEQ